MHFNTFSNMYEFQKGYAKGKKPNEKTACGMACIQCFRTDRTIETEILSVIPRSWGWAQMGERAQRTFESDGNVLNLNCGSSYMTMQLSKHIELLHLNGTFN